ncbi:MAG: outer membrane protein transport protein, partial [gamma proteobacterium symbiont of Bathyaustriella thionipta]|nr:outer membrane protein transport protein [gamma proteobacterium symbiont of Bathyaustriella thionipta]
MHAVSTSLQAGGFSVPENSIFGLGMANAVVANPDEIGTFAYNPAAMVFHEDSSVSFGLMGVAPDVSVDTASGSHDSDAKDLVAIPMFQANVRLGESWALGIGVNSPFGLETDWESGTFPTLTGPAAAAHPTKSNLEMIAIVPTLAYRINENFGISAGVDFYNAIDVDLNTTLVDVTGDGTGLGWNTALMAQFDALSLGASYHSAATIDIEGKFSPDFSIGPGIPPGVTIPAEADIDLPWRFQAGVRYAFNDAWAAEFDYTRTGWSEFEEIHVKTETGGNTLSRSVSNWDDASAYRVGVSWNIVSAKESALLTPFQNNTSFMFQGSNASTFS